MSSENANRSMDVDPKRMFVYSSDNDSIKLHHYSPIEDDVNVMDGVDLSYLNTIPVVRTWDNQVVKPDNLLLYKGGECMLLSDADAYDSILNLDIERGIVSSKQSVHKSFGGRTRSNMFDDDTSEDVVFKVRKFDYNSQGDLAQYEKCAVGINSNHIMRFDLKSGTMVHQKAYEINPHFTALTTDTNGNVIVGDEEGKIRVFPDVGKRAAKSTTGLGDPITYIKVSNKGDVIATTDHYFIFLPDLVRNSQVHTVGKLSQEVIDYLGLEGSKMRNAQFSEDEKSVLFSIGKYMFHQRIEHVISREQEYKIYQADGEILCLRFVGGQFALTDKPVRFKT